MFAPSVFVSIEDAAKRVSGSAHAFLAKDETDAFSCARGRHLFALWAVRACLFVAVDLPVVMTPPKAHGVTPSRSSEAEPRNAEQLYARGRGSHPIFTVNHGTISAQEEYACQSSADNAG